MIIKASAVYCIVKFGPKSHMDEFRTKGRLFMNTLRYFKNLEAKDKLRSDKSEGLTASFPAAKVRVAINGAEIGHLTGQVRFGDPEDDQIGIFSMYALTELNKDVVIENKVLGFGDTAVVILKGDEFIDRVKAECKNRGWSYSTDLVGYVNKDAHEGEMGPFRKYSDLSYQSEFRIAIKSGRSGPIEDFYIGDISDITHISDSATVKEIFKIEKEA